LPRKCRWRQEVHGHGFLHHRQVSLHQLSCGSDARVIDHGINATELAYARTNQIGNSIAIAHVASYRENLPRSLCRQRLQSIDAPGCGKNDCSFGYEGTRHCCA
jgi:hypothetical protein